MADPEDIQALLDGEKDLVGRDFRAADLSGRNLRRRDFAGSYLQGANLSGGDLDEAVFGRAQLSRLTAHGAKLRAANFKGCVLTNADFQNADLREADFSRAHISRTSFAGADLRNASFIGANIREGTAFTDAIVDETTLFNDAQIFRPLAKEPAFRYYYVEQGKLIRKTDIPDEIPTGNSGLPLADRRAAVEAIESARAALRRATELETPSFPSKVGIGHNRPPLDAALSPEDIERGFEALSVIETQIESPEPDREIIVEAGDVLAEYSSRIGKWAVKKAEIFVDEFAKSLGKEAATAKFWVALWLVVSGQLTILLNLITKIFGH